MAERNLTTTRGAGALARLLADRTAGVPEGEMEREFLDLVRRHRLPAPARQHRVGRFRLDFSYPDVLIAIELDDIGSHGTPAGLQRDLERQNELILCGWTILRFTWADVTRRPAEVAKTIRRALHR
jgi:very-short-patch-repair endonuclease